MQDWWRGGWLTAAIGVAAGMGEEATAVLSALLAYGILRLVPTLVSRTEVKQASPPQPTRD